MWLIIGESFIIHQTRQLRYARINPHLNLDLVARNRTDDCLENSAWAIIKFSKKFSTFELVFHHRFNQPVVLTQPHRPTWLGSQHPLDEKTRENIAWQLLSRSKNDDYDWTFRKSSVPWRRHYAIVFNIAQGWSYIRPFTILSLLVGGRSFSVHHLKWFFSNCHLMRPPC